MNDNVIKGPWKHRKENDEHRKKVQDDIAFIENICESVMVQLIHTMNENEIVRNPEDISLSLRIGLNADDHLALHGIKRSSAEGKMILERFENNINQTMQIVEEKMDNDSEIIENDEQNDEATTQFSLDDFS